MKAARSAPLLNPADGLSGAFFDPVSSGDTRAAIHRIGRKSTVFAAVDAVGKLVALGVVVVLAHKQLPSDFGLTVSAMAGSAIIQMLVDGGQGILLARAVLGDATRAHSIVSARFTVALGVCLPAAVALALPISAWRVVAAGIIVGSSSATLSVAALLASNHVNRAALALVAPNVLFLLLLLAVSSVTVVAALLLFAACNFAIALASVGFRSELWPGLATTQSVIRAYRLGLPTGLYTLSTTVYGKADTVLLAVFVSPAIAGVYATYYRVVLAVVGFTSWVGPLAARHLSAPTGVRARLVELLKRLAVVAFFLTAVLLLAGPIATSIVTHGGKVPEMAAIWLSLLTIPTVLAAPLAYALVMNHREFRLARVSLLVMIVALALYPVAIQLGGATGAAASSFVVEMLSLVLLTGEVRLIPTVRRNEESR